MLSDHFAANEDTLNRLEKTIHSGRLAHAILLTGESGTGKTRLAQLIAQTVCCRAEDGDDRPCGECAACRKCRDGLHPDVLVYGKNGGTSRSFHKKDIEALRGELYLRPNEAPLRVFILDSVELLTSEAANSLLKSLEEPPESAILILTASSRTLLPATIVSRVVEFVLTPPPPEKAAPYIARLAGCEPAAALSAARQFGGNIGQAVARLTDETVRARYELCKKLLDSDAHERSVLMAKLIPARAAKKTDDDDGDDGSDSSAAEGGAPRVPKASAQRAELIALVTLLRQQLCSALLAKQGGVPGAGLPDGLERRLSSERLADLADAASDALAALNANGNTQGILSLLADRLTVR